MSEKKPLFPFFRLGKSRQEKSNGKHHDKRKDGQAVPPVVVATPSSTAGTMADAPPSQTAKTEPSTIQLQSSMPTSYMQEPITPTAEDPLPAVNDSPAREASSALKDPAIPIPPDQLWDEAYDRLKHDEPGLFKLYEAILLHDLDGAKGNALEQDRSERRSQMDRLLNAGFNRIANHEHVEKKIGDTIRIVLSVKEAIGSALQAVPVAAVVWTGICVALQASSPSAFDYWF